MSAWTPRFLYRSLVPGGTVTASDEVATLPDGNLQSAAPSVKWRADTLSSLNVVTAFSADVDAWDTAFLGYTNLTPKRNLLQDSNLLNGSPSAPWTLTNLSGTQTERVIAPETADGLCYLMDAGTNAGVHKIAQTVTLTVAPRAEESFLLSAYFDIGVSGTAADAVRIKMTENSASVYVDYNFSTGLSAVTEGTDWSGATAAATSATFGSNTSIRVDLFATKDSGAAMGNVDCEVYLLSGGSESFTGANEQVYLAQVFHSLGTSFPGPEIPTEDNRGPLFSISGDVGMTTVVDVKGFHAIPRGLSDYKTDRGWVHGVAYAASEVHYTGDVTLNISDEDNSDAYVEAGVLMIGKSFQPTGTLVGGNSPNKGYMAGIRRTFEAGRWVWEIEFDYLDADTAERDFMDMYFYCNANDDGQESIRAAGGQRYSKRRPVLFIADTGAGTSEPERVIYGELLGSAPLAWSHRNKHRITVRIGEFPA